MKFLLLLCALLALVGCEDETRRAYDADMARFHAFEDSVRVARDLIERQRQFQADTTRQHQEEFRRARAKARQDSICAAVAADSIWWRDRGMLPLSMLQRWGDDEGAQLWMLNDIRRLLVEIKEQRR